MPTPELIPEYDEVDQALEILDAEAGASEGHGVLCGMLAGGSKPSDEAWMTEVVAASVAHPESTRMLRALYDFTIFQLDDPNLSFQPLLPGDGEPLEKRTLALSHWCSGFLYGLGLSQAGSSARLSESASEVVHDMMKISQVDYELEGASEAEEHAFAEVVEYLRVGTLLIAEVFRGPQGGEQIH